MCVCVCVCPVAMEEEVAELTEERQLDPETENTILLSLAGLKHVGPVIFRIF